MRTRTLLLLFLAPALHADADPLPDRKGQLEVAIYERGTSSVVRHRMTLPPDSEPVSAEQTESWASPTGWQRTRLTLWFRTLVDEAKAPVLDYKIERARSVLGPGATILSVPVFSTSGRIPMPNPGERRTLDETTAGAQSQTIELARLQESSRPSAPK